MRTAQVVLAGAVIAVAACGGPAVCPLVAPTNDSDCGDRGLVCESGGTPHRRCSTAAACQDALDPSNPTRTAWSVNAPAGCTAENDAACPASYGSVPVAKACPTQGLSCDYAEGRCACVPCNPSDPTASAIAWRCRAWSSGLAAGCPSERPLLGSRCDVDRFGCAYDDACRVSFGPDLVCFNQVWTPRIGAPRTCAAPVCGVDN